MASSLLRFGTFYHLTPNVLLHFSYCWQYCLNLSKTFVAYNINKKHHFLKNIYNPSHISCNNNYIDKKHHIFKNIYNPSHISRNNYIDKRFVPSNESVKKRS